MTNTATILTYIFAPPSAFIASTIDLKLTIENPITGSTIHWQGGPDGDEIDITFPVGSSGGDLTNQLPTQVDSQTKGFTCARSNAFFAIKSPTGATLNPGDKIVVVFKDVVINGVTGDVPVKIQEYVGSSSNNGSVSITKLPQELGIIAWLDPYVVGLFQTSSLNWQSMGGIGVTVQGFASGTGSKDFPVSGQPPYPGATSVTVPSQIESQRTYTLQVYTGDHRHAQQAVTLTQHAPMITSFVGDKSSPLKANASVSLSWNSLFGASSLLQSNAGMNRNSPLSPLAVNPGQELAAAFSGNYDNMPATVNYTLTVNGFEQPASEQVSFTILPVNLVYFKYTQRDSTGILSGIKAVTDPEEWTAQALSFPANNLAVLTIYQPGGIASTYYLGAGDTTHPQIQYFNAENKGGNSFELSWVTANLDVSKGMILLPGNIKIDGNDVKQGTKTLSITATTEYTLSGVGTSGESIVSKLIVQATI